MAGPPATPAAEVGRPRPVPRWALLGPMLLTLAALLGLAALASVLAGDGQDGARVTPGADGHPQLLLDARLAPVWQAWPAVGVLAETAGPLDLAGARARAAAFQPPRTPWANLGLQRQGVWLRVPLQAAPGAPGWLLDIDYPALQQVDVYLLRDGRLLQQQRLGGVLRFDERPVPSRTPALLLALQPGVPHELYLRVQTHSALVLPLAFSTPEAYQAREARRQLVQGLLIGVALALMAYSLAHGLSLRSPLFGLYAVMLAGTTLFLVHLYGIGQQHLWPDWPAVQAVVSPMALLLALAAAGPFVALALDTRGQQPWLHRGLLGLATACGAVLALALAGGVPYAAMRQAVVLLGLPLALLAAVASWRQALRGDRVAAWMLVGWTTYLSGGLSTAALLYGLLPARLWTLHAFQVGWLVEILAWLRVLTLHIEAVRLQAQQAEVEKRALRSLAHTDALTGLPNRRGLQTALAQALAQAQPGRPLAVMLVDLDGFKPVNDRLGHEAGDALLVQVGQRLRARLRQTDTVARLGGDEFVVLAVGLRGAAEAETLGAALLRAFEPPFVLQGLPGGPQSVRVGLTLGCALAPDDGQDPDALLAQADAAMYAGKRAGRGTWRRAGGAAAGGGASGAEGGPPLPQPDRAPEGWPQAVAAARSPRRPDGRQAS